MNNLYYFYVLKSDRDKATWGYELYEGRSYIIYTLFQMFTV